MQIKLVVVVIERTIKKKNDNRNNAKEKGNMVSRR